MRLLFVTPRFGRGVVGGAETLVRGLATRAVAPDDEVSIATTCALDHTTWANELPAGESHEDGLRVLRFPVNPRDDELHLRLRARLQSTGRLSYTDGLNLLGTGVWSEDLQRFLEQHGTRFDAIIFTPYLFGTTFWGIQAHPERSLLLPCLHDEADAYLDCLRAPFGAAAGWIFNTAAEEHLARSIFSVRRSGVVGMGFDPPSTPARPGFAAAHGLGRYLLYAGRLERAKRVDVAVEYTARFIAEQASDLRLVLIGSGSYRVPERYRHAVLELGYVDEQTKRSAMAEALALVNPSELESLSLVLLEAWREGTPALVAAGSDVMREHCERSGGGLAFSNYQEFTAAVERFASSPEVGRRMGDNGQTYVADSYSWPTTAGRFRQALQGATDATEGSAQFGR